MFQAPKLTNAGKALYYDSLGGTAIKITTIKLGNGTLTDPIATMSNLVNPLIVINATVSKSKGNNKYVNVSGAFSNANISDGFYWREIGVFVANNEFPDDRSKDIMFCYQNAYDTADFIPAASIETVEKNITIPMIVGDAENVECLIDSSLIFATLKDIEIHNEDSEAHKDIRDILIKKADVGLDGKIPFEQIPDITSSFFFNNVLLPISAFVEDTTYTDYPFSADIEIDDVTTDFVSDINFLPKDADSGIFAAVTKTENGKVTVYAKTIPESDILIPTIECRMGEYVASRDVEVGDAEFADDSEVMEVINTVFG